MKESDQNDHRVLRSIKPLNLLSFGPETPALELQALNLFIGPNGSGKSNLIEALALMRATPVAPETTLSRDVRGVLRRGGGAQEWIWQGAKNQPATVELVINNPKGKQPLRHVFGFLADAQGFRLYDERVEDEAPDGDAAEPHFYHLVRASNRTQLIVTTHSDILVDAMTERPEAVVVCEKHDGKTEMRRLKKEEVTVWLDKYRLGELWTRGQIGGSLRATLYLELGESADISSLPPSRRGAEASWQLSTKSS